MCETDELQNQVQIILHTVAHTGSPKPTAQQELRKSMFNAHERRTVWPSWHEGQTDSGISIYSRLVRAQLHSGKWRGEKGEGGGWGGEGEEEEEEEQEAASVFAPPKVDTPRKWPPIAVSFRSRPP